MRLFTPVALAASAAVLGTGMIAAPAAQAATPHQEAAITFNCADNGPVPAVYPPWVNGRTCAPSTIGRFKDVDINITHWGSWHCKTAESSIGDRGSSNVLGKDCEGLGN